MKNGLILRRVVLLLVVAGLLAFSVTVGIAVSHWHPQEIHQ